MFFNGDLAILFGDFYQYSLPGLQRERNSGNSFVCRIQPNYFFTQLTNRVKTCKQDLKYNFNPFLALEKDKIKGKNTLKFSSFIFIYGIN